MNLSGKSEPDLSLAELENYNIHKAGWQSVGKAEKETFAQVLQEVGYR